MVSIDSADIYIKKVIDLPIEEFLGKYHPTRAFRCLTSERPENIVATFVTDEIVDFYMSVDSRVKNNDRWTIFNIAKEMLEKEGKIVKRIIKEDKKLLDDLMEEFSSQTDSFTEIDSGNFLRKKGISPTKAVIAYFYRAVREYRLNKKKSS